MVNDGDLAWWFFTTPVTPTVFTSERWPQFLMRVPGYSAPLPMEIEEEEPVELTTQEKLAQLGLKILRGVLHAATFWIFW